MANCKCKLKLKDEYKAVFKNNLILNAINLSELTEKDFENAAAIFPQAFERKCTCTNKTNNNAPGIDPKLN